MAQTPLGALKLAARKAGITLEEYTANRNAGLKWCYKCRSWKPLADYSADKSRYDGLHAKCESCRCTNRVGPSIPERRRMASIELGWCSGCAEWKPLHVFRNGKCRTCYNAAVRKRYATNPAHRAMMCNSTMTRRRGVDPLPMEAQEFYTNLFDGLCAYCDNRATTWDHITPISKGGRTTPGNILPACRTCNSSKKNRDVFDWLEATGRELKELTLDRIAFSELSLYG